MFLRAIKILLPRETNTCITTFLEEKKQIQMYLYLCKGKMSNKFK